MTQQTLAAALPAGTPPAPSPRARDLVQSILADYYNVADGEGRPIASLLVLVDSAKQPVRAELHLSGTATDESGRQAVRQAQHIIEERYTGPDALPLQVWQSFLRSDPLHIALAPSEAGDAPAVIESLTRGLTFPWKPLALVVIALVLLAWLAGVVNWARGGLDAATTPTIAESGGTTSPSEPAAGANLPASALTPVDQPLPAADASTGGSAPVVEAIPTSIYANPAITIGRRVRIRDGVNLTLRSEPGSNAGEVVGFMQNGDEATVIGGPTQLRGDSDTIVWWEVQLDDGKTAWAAANLSTMTLLDPVD